MSPSTVRACAAALLAAACSADTATIQPLQWQKIPGSGPKGALLGPNPVPGSFDERGNFTVRAFKEGGVTFLYYGGSDADDIPACASPPGSIESTHWRIGLAQSVDGIDFTRVQIGTPGGEILGNGDPGAFDSQLTYRPFVLHDGDTWRMWYNGSAKPFNCAGALADDRLIGYADSADGFHWTKHYDGNGPGGSVLPLGATGSIDARQVGYAWVLKDGAQYKMYYSANDVFDVWRVALAVSTDARTWTKVRGKNSDGSILDVGASGAFDAACAYQPSVVKESASLYRMWYRGCQQAAPGGGPSQGVIGYAESNDGVTWVKVTGGGPGGAALVQGDASAFDSVGLTSPSVFLDGDTWNMYYAGFDAAGVVLSGLARAPRR